MATLFSFTSVTRVPGALSCVPTTVASTPPDRLPTGLAAGQALPVRVVFIAYQTTEITPISIGYTISMSAMLGLGHHFRIRNVSW
jgi:hypothetical protein